MVRSTSADERAREEAAAWFARLNRRSVPLQSLDEFRIWRQVPQNRAAYQALDAHWRDAGGLAEDPEIGAALSTALARAAPRRRATRAWSLAGAAAGLAVLAGVTAVVLGPGRGYSTGVGEARTVRLADGTTVQLDTDTKINVAFRGGERQVQLTQGQAFFDVAHDAAHPFIVQAGPLRVRAVGTRFDVRRDGAGAKVTLVEGVVRVNGGAAQPAAWTLKPGEQVSVGRTVLHQNADIDLATSWTRGRVIFQGMPLAQAIDEINRYSPHKVRLAAQSIADVPVTGSFQTGDTNAFVTAITDLHGLIATKSADGTIVLDANPARGA